MINDNDLKREEQYNFLTQVRDQLQEEIKNTKDDNFRLGYYVQLLDTCRGMNAILAPCIHIDSGVLERLISHVEISK